MKTKALFFVLTLLATIMFGCSDKDDNSEMTSITLSELTGTWEMSVVNTKSESSANILNGATITFFKDGKLIILNEETGEAIESEFTLISDLVITPYFEFNFENVSKEKELIVTKFKRIDNGNKEELTVNFKRVIMTYPLPEGSLLLGTWQLISTTDLSGNVTLANGTYTIKLYINGFFKEFGSFKPDENSEYNYLNWGKYTYSNGYISARFGQGRTMNAEVVSVSATNLVLKASVDGVISLGTYVKIP